MLERTGSLVAVRLLAGAAVVALAVAACGGSSSTPSPAGTAAAPTQAAPAATPAPTAPPEQPSASAQAGGGSTSAGCADMAAVSSALKNVDHYVATATIAVPIPGASAEGGGMGMDMVMKFQKPDSFEMTTGVGGGVLFAMRKVGKDSWLQMFGADTWTKADASTGSTQSDPDLFSRLQSDGLEPLAQIPAGLDLPGSSSCVIGYSVKVPAAAGSGDSGDPLSTLTSATAVAVRVDTSTNLPQSMGVLIDTSAASAGTPSAIVFTFDYQAPVDIQPPDPSKVTKGGGLGGFPLPSGLVLPSGLLTQP